MHHRAARITAALLVGGAAWTGARAAEPAAAATIRNPIIAGDWSDPALLKVGDDFYTCRSSFGWQPGLPIAHSRDLVHWEYVGHAFDSRDDLIPGDTKNGIWGADLGFNPHTREFLVFAPLRNHAVFVYHAAKPAGPYAVAKLGDDLGIDPGFFADTDGRLYLVLSRGVIHELARDGLSIVGEAARVDRSRFRFFEGPSLTKHGGWYYLLFSDGGTLPREPSTVSTLRARKLAGPWEPDPANPVLFSTDSGAQFEGPAHGTLVEVAPGRWYVAYHAHEPRFDSLGRQLLLSPVEWTDDGWWRVAAGKIPQAEIPSSGLPSGTARLAQSDEFAGPTLGLQWFFLCAPDRSGRAWSLTESPGALRLRTQPGNLASRDALPGVLQQRVTGKRFTLTARVHFAAHDGNEAAGIHLYHDPAMNLWLTSTVRDGRPVIAAGATVLGERRELARRENTIGADVFLRLAVEDDERATFAFSADGKTWERLGDGVYFGSSGHHLRGGQRGEPDLGWVGRYKDRSLDEVPVAQRDTRWEIARRGNVWTGATMGVFAVRDGATADNAAEFDFFRVEPLAASAIR